MELKIAILHEHSVVTEELLRSGTADVVIIEKLFGSLARSPYSVFMPRDINYRCYLVVVTTELAERIKAELDCRTDGSLHEFPRLVVEEKSADEVKQELATLEF